MSAARLNPVDMLFGRVMFTDHWPPDVRIEIVEPLGIFRVWAYPRLSLAAVTWQTVNDAVMPLTISEQILAEFPLARDEEFLEEFEPLYPERRYFGKRRLENGRYRRSRSTSHGDPLREPHPVIRAARCAAVSTAYRRACDPFAGETPHAGIRAGEIIGHRCWRFVDHRSRILGDKLLSSCFVGMTWLPKIPMRGSDPWKTDYGVHAFKSVERTRSYAQLFAAHDLIDRVGGSEELHDFSVAIHYLAGEESDFLPLLENAFGVKARGPVMVRGTVSLWGEVVEHEKGWRAEYASIRSLDEVLFADSPEEGATLLARLRDVYGVENAAPATATPGTHPLASPKESKT